MSKALKEKPQPPPEFQTIEWVLTAAFGVVAAYLFAFSRLDFGGPADWGAFGDYFGGIMNPVVGVITVILLVRTLQVTRNEAAGQRKLFQEQMADFRREKILAEHQKRLAGAFQSWEALLTNKVQIIDKTDRHGLVRIFHNRPLADVFADPALTYKAMHREDSVEIVPPDAWVMTYRCSALLKEIAHYTASYDAAYGDGDGARVLTDFYRNRVKGAAYIIFRLGHKMDIGVAEELYAFKD